MLNVNSRSKVAKLLGVIGSSSDAEALSAARKAHQLIKAAGTTWQDALGVSVDAPLLNPPPHAIEAKDLLKAGKGILTDFEHRFLVGLLGFKRLSPKQAAVLADIKAKVAATEAA